jgi:hypothetical protein
MKEKAPPKVSSQDEDKDDEEESTLDYFKKLAEQD